MLYLGALLALLCLHRIYVPRSLESAGHGKRHTHFDEDHDDEQLVRGWRGARDCKRTIDAMSKQDWSQPDVGVGVAESGRLDVRIWNPLVGKGTTTAQSAPLV